MRVRLTRKLADMIDGVDLSGHNPGDLLNLPEAQGRLIVAEQWGIEERRAVDREESPRQFVSRSAQQRARSAADSSGPRRSSLTRHRRRS